MILSGQICFRMMKVSLNGFQKAKERIVVQKRFRCLLSGSSRSARCISNLGAGNGKLRSVSQNGNSSWNR